MSAIVPVRDLSTREVLYGARSTSFRFELLKHDPVTGVDSLAGVLDGVQPGGSLSWSAAKSVKKSGSLTVNDLERAAPGAIRLADVDVMNDRIRPVMVIEGLPEIPLSVYVLRAPDEQWSGTGRVFEIEMNDKSAVLVDDLIPSTFTALADVPVLQIVRTVIESAGERISVDASVTATLAAPRVWEVGTSKLRIVNDLLEAINYNALWVDGQGAFRATPYVRPASRSIRYSMLNDESGSRIVRELTDGDESIYLPVWTRGRNLFDVPNRVVAVQSAGGDAEPLVGVAENLNPDSEFSFPSRGRWITRVLEDVDTPDLSPEDTVIFLEARALMVLEAASSPQSKVSVSCLPIPVELTDAITFASTPAAISARHTVQRVELDLAFDGLMRLDLVEVVDL